MKTRTGYSLVHVDDNKETLKQVKQLIERNPDLQYLAGCSSADEALTMLETVQPDLLLLDIEMPEKDGLWLAGQLQLLRTDIVFLTNHVGYATRAFEACALDFILKPLDEAKLHVLVERLRYKQNGAGEDVRQQIKAIYQYLNPDLYPTRIFVPGTGRTEVVNLTDILYFEASRNYTNIKTVTGEPLLSSRSLRTYEEALRRHPDFIRISRNVLVNKTYVKAVERHPKTFRICAVMTNAETLETSFKTKRNLLERLLNTKISPMDNY